MNNRFRIVSSVLISALSINSALALPIDWSGVFGADTHMISNTCRTSDNVARPVPRDGTYALASDDCDASFQTYIFRLHPSIIVNDAVTLKGELSSGYLRGGFAGGEGANNADGSPNNSFFFVSPAQRSALNVNQMYMELFADTALVRIGRMQRHYGTGMIFDGGDDAWDRFITMYDGIMAEMKIGNFSVLPYYAKIANFSDAIANNPSGNATGTQPNGSADVRELGLTAVYDNKNKDFVASVLYGKRSSEANSFFFTTTDGTTVSSRGSTEVTVIEPFVSKRWNKLVVAAEASIQTGDFGQIYAPGENSKLSAQAYYLEAKYELNPKWETGVQLVNATGDDGSTSTFEGAYLHPNFHVTNLMFRYNYPAFAGDIGTSIFDQSINNARIYKAYANYKMDKWILKGSFILANALETAQAGQRAFQSERGYRFTATQDQADDYGYEMDLAFDYRWNPNVVISGYYAYWWVGDYYAFTNTANELSLENVHGGGLRATLEF